MKRKSICLLVFLILGFTTHIFGQDTLTIELSFTAKYEQEHIPLDSILIMNLTQGTETVLYEPDTVLVVDYIPFGTMINPGKNNANNFSVSPNYPNPFKNRTSIDISIAEAEDILIRIYDLSGREHATFEKFMETGKHTFDFYPGRENFYIFSVSYKGLTNSIKIANPFGGKSNCQLSYKGYENQSSNLKSIAASNFLIYENDIMRYFGYALTPGWVIASHVIDDEPVGISNTHLFNVLEGIPCIDMPTVEYSGVTYHTLQIGTQCWMRENLNYGDTMISGLQEQTNNEIVEKYCFADLEMNCEAFGALYQWNEAMKYNSILPGEQGICPNGWHIPTNEEFKQLEGTVDTQYGYPDPIWDTSYYRGYDVGKRLKSADSWQSGIGTNNYGFSALGTGCRFVDGTFVNKTRYTSFWSSDPLGGGIFVYYRHLEHLTDMMALATAPAIMGRSVRCMRDE